MSMESQRHKHSFEPWESNNGFVGSVGTNLSPSWRMPKSSHTAGTCLQAPLLLRFTGNIIINHGALLTTKNSLPTTVGPLLT